MSAPDRPVILWVHHAGVTRPLPYVNCPSGRVKGPFESEKAALAALQQEESNDE